VKVVAPKTPMAPRARSSVPKEDSSRARKRVVAAGMSERGIGTSGAGHDPEAHGPPPLRLGEVHLRLRSIREAALVYVPHHAHHHQDDLLGFRVVAGHEQPSLEEVHAHRPEIAGPHHPEVHCGRRRAVGHVHALRRGGEGSRPSRAARPSVFSGREPVSSTRSVEFHHSDSICRRRVPSGRRRSTPPRPPRRWRHPVLPPR